MRPPEQLLTRVRMDVDNTLDRLVPTPDIDPQTLHEAIRWSLFGGGKRIRPAILIAVGETFDAEPAQMLATAAAVEMIHTYSLIHDDLPSMDDDDLRRGRATCHRRFGEATAILAGDALQTLAFKAIADDDTLTADTRLRLISLIAEASGTPYGMVSGQQLDLEAERTSHSIDKIASIHAQKTGALISASAVAGAVIGNASDPDIAAIGQYSEALGLLFQITDDLLDVTQETETLGKTAGKDAVAGKATYPSRFGPDGTHRVAVDTRDIAWAALSRIDKDTEILREFASMILDRAS